MKPTKNQYFCVDCNRPKMLFATKKKALRCIELNGDEIYENSGRRPVRAYYCMACGGWHITSNPEKRFINSRVESYFRSRAKIEKVMRRLLIDTESCKTITQIIKAKVHDFRMAVARKTINVTRCDDLFRKLSILFKEIATVASMTPEIHKCFNSFCKLGEQYQNKINKGHFYRSLQAC